MGTLFGVLALFISLALWPQAFAQTPASGIMQGTNMNLLISPSTFNPSTDSNVTLTFIPNSNVPTLVTDNVVKHLDYNITVSKDGNIMFNQKFHTHNGNLTLVFASSSGQATVTGGQSDPAQTTTGPFYISGSTFNETGNYEISAQVVGVNFSPINPLEDKFTLQVVPEFGSIVPIVLVIAIIGAVVLTTKIRAISRL